MKVSLTGPDELAVRDSSGALHLSRDGGSAWNQLLSGGEPVQPLTGVLAFSPYHDGWIYALSFPGPLLRSTDHGATWEELLTDPEHASSQVWPPLIVEEGGSETVYLAASDGLLRVAGGQSAWLPFPFSASLRSLAADPADPQRIVAATSAGASCIADGGASWGESNSGLIATALDLVFAGPSGSGTLFAADTGALYAMDAAGPWSRALTFGARGHYAPALAAAAPPRAVYLAAQETVTLSTNGGADWEDRSTGLPSGDWARIFGLAANQRHPGDAWAATEAGLYRTLDGGLRWNQVDTGEEPYPVSVAVDPDDFLHVVVGLSEDPPPWGNVVPVVLSPTDAGATWQRGGIQLSVEAAGFAFPRGTSAVLAATRIGVFRSEDGGVTWSASSAGMDIQCDWLVTATDSSFVSSCTDHVGGVARDPVRAGTVYASSERGVWRSTDAGASWTLLEPALGAWGSYAPGIVGGPSWPLQAPWNPYAISVAPDGSRLYAAAICTGVLALDLAAYQPPPEERTVRRRVGRTR